jgi:capsular exopolysaccharide synthesis family protein
MKKAQPIAADAGNDKFLQQLAIKYLPYWPFFLILIIISLSLAYAYLQYAIPIYESSASILIKDEKKGQEDSKMEELLNLFDSHKIIENELEILRSTEVLNEVVIQMRLYAPVYTESGWHGLITRSAYNSCPVVVEASDPRTIKSAKNVYFTISPDSGRVEIAETVYPLGQWVSSPWGSIRFIKNPTYKLKNPMDKDSPDAQSGEVKYFFSLIKITNETDILGESLVTAQASKQSSVINIKIKDAIPERGEAIITSIVNAYNLNAIKKKSEVATNTLNFIEDRLRSVKYQLDSVESSIQKYRNRTGIVDISEQSKLYLQSMAANDQQRNKMKIQLNVLNEVESYLETKNELGSIIPSTAEISDPTLTQLVNKLNNSQSEYARLRKTTAENNPILSGIQNEITKTKADVLEAVKTQKSNLMSNQVYVNQISNRDSAMANAIPQKERELVEVSRQRNTTADIYAFLLQKREEAASYSVGSILPDSYIVDKATSTPFPVSPKKSVLLILGIVLPLMLGAFSISLKAALNNKILYRADIEKLTNYPVIGEIIQGKFENGLVTASKERSFIIEQFRLLRSSVKNLPVKPPGQLKRLVVTSSVEGEGKSFVATNLANIITRSNKKVVLLEMDLHQPSICELLGLQRGAGITDYLTGKATAEEILLQTPFNPDLYFVQAGKLEEDASELLLNGKIEVLMDFLNSKADVLIIDMPPINPITDLYVIAPLCDYTLYVVRHGKVRKNNIQMLSENMNSHNIKNVVIVFNGIKKRGIGQYSYGYGYGYGYDYKSSYDSYGKAKKKKTV